MSENYYCVCGKCGKRTYSYEHSWYSFNLCFEKMCFGRIEKKSYPKPEATGFKKGDRIRFTRFPKTDPECMQLATISDGLDGDMFMVNFEELKRKSCKTDEEFVAESKRIDKFLIPLVAARGHHPAYDIELLTLCDKEK